MGLPPNGPSRQGLGAELAGGITGNAWAESTGPDIRVITRARNGLVVLMCRPSYRLVQTSKLVEWCDPPSLCAVLRACAMVVMVPLLQLDHEASCSPRRTWPGPGTPGPERPLVGPLNNGDLCSGPVGLGGWDDLKCLGRVHRPGYSGDHPRP